MFFPCYEVRPGFLDGQADSASHFLQRFWCRYLVDAKVAEVERHMARQGCSAVDAIRAVLEIDVG